MHPYWKKYGRVKTTIGIPDALYRRAKMEAVFGLRGVNLIGEIVPP